MWMKRKDEQRGGSAQKFGEVTVWFGFLVFPAGRQQGKAGMRRRRQLTGPVERTCHLRWPVCPGMDMWAPFTHCLSYPGQEAAGAREVYDVWGFHGP